MKASTPFALVSADTEGTPEQVVDNRRTWFEYQLQKLGFNYRKVQGQYKGVKEHSYLVLIEDDGQRPALYRLAKAFQQEAVLEVDSNGYAALFDADGNHVRELGQWREITQSLADELDAYTYAGGRYYAALPA